MMITDILKQRIVSESHIKALFSKINMPDNLLADRFGVDIDTIARMTGDHSFQASLDSFPIQFCMESMAMAGSNSLGILPFHQKANDYRIERDIIDKQAFITGIDESIGLPKDAAAWNYPQLFFLEVLSLNELLNGQTMVISENGLNQPLHCQLKGQKMIVSFKEEPDFIKEVESTFVLSGDHLKSVRKISDICELVVSQYLAKQSLSLFLRQQEKPTKAIRVHKKKRNSWGLESMSIFQRPSDSAGFTVFIGESDPLKSQDMLNDIAYQIATK